MIGKLKGKLVEIDKNIGLIETYGGVFYQVFLPPRLLSTFHLQTPSSILHPLPSIEIYTYLQVREDALILYGFQTKQEHDFFRLLLTVPGVGPKTAYSVISFLSVDDINKAVTENNIDTFTKVPGLGKKTAMKIILELTSKLKQEFSLEKMYLSEEDKLVVDALVSLGFKTFDAKKILQQIPKNLSVEEKIKKGLQLTGSKKT